MTDEKRPSPAASFAMLYPRLVEAARPLGYALALHGSLQRDMDVIAVPWVEGAASAEELVEAVRAVFSGWIGSKPGEERAHGRRCWSIVFDDMDSHEYLDLSVMPRQERESDERH